MTISSTIYAHKNIHKYTRKSSDVSTVNQIDHILIQNRSSIHDVRSFRVANCNTNYYLVIAKFKFKLSIREYTKNKMTKKFDVEWLEIESVQEKYIETITKELEKTRSLTCTVKTKWQQVQKHN
uniref:Uncharacterized protein n=1 Tax=Sipha flava TaxID=143950 RepID=A0A2S2Q406_9HEMI